jgi:hypothetical protein
MDSGLPADNCQDGRELLVGEVEFPSIGWPNQRHPIDHPHAAAGAGVMRVLAEGLGQLLVEFRGER